MFVKWNKYNNNNSNYLLVSIHPVSYKHINVVHIGATYTYIVNILLFQNYVQHYILKKLFESLNFKSNLSQWTSD